MSDMTWREVADRAMSGLKERGKNGLYEERLLFEIREVEKQS